MALVSISSMEQGCAFLPSVWEEDAEPHCRAGPARGLQARSQGSQALPGQGWGSSCFFHGEKIFCQPWQQYQGVSSPIGDKLAPVLYTAVPTGRDVTHPLAAPTWVLPAAPALLPPACSSAPDHWQSASRTLKHIQGNSASRLTGALV